MATKEIKLEDGAYFKALYKRKPIRGQISLISDNYNTSEYWLGNSSLGEECQCDDVENNYDFRRYVHVEIEKDDNENEIGVEKALRSAGITQLEILKDRRQQKVVDRDKLPEVAGYRALPDGNTIAFGCGAIEVTKDEIKNFLTIRRIVKRIGEDKFEEYFGLVKDIKNEGVRLEDIDLKVVEKLLTL